MATRIAWRWKLPTVSPRDQVSRYETSRAPFRPQLSIPQRLQFECLRHGSIHLQNLGLVETDVNATLNVAQIALDSAVAGDRWDFYCPAKDLLRIQWEKYEWTILQDCDVIGLL